MAELLEALSSSSQVGEVSDASSSASSLSDSWSASSGADSRPERRAPDKRGSVDDLRAIPFASMGAAPESRALVTRRSLGVLAYARLYVVLLLETLGRRRFERVARQRMRGERLVVHGTIPEGGVVLAANHYPDAGCLGVVSALLTASARHADFAIVAGDNTADPKRTRSAVLRPIVLLLRAALARWRGLLLRVPTGNASPRIDALRAFREGAKERCVLVFPEGRVHRALGPIRAGAGRFLRSIESPTIPVAVYRTDDAWHVRFGAPIAWTRDRTLADQQLGLSIAALLPRELATGWRDLLDGWRTAHGVSG